MKVNKYIAPIAALLLMGAPSCSDDDAPLTPLTEVSVVNTRADYKSLTFVWDKVADATQYGYELLDNAGELIVRSVTDQTEVTVAGLEADTEYTLKVWAYAAIGSGMATSEPYEIKATTDPLMLLGTPTVEYDIVAGSRYVFSWTAVEYAEGYSYALVDSNGEIVKEGDTVSRTALFTNLDKGEYTFKVKATTTAGGYEKEGPTVSLSFTVS